MPRHHFSLNQSLWICGKARSQEILYPRIEIAALRERGAEVFLFGGATDTKGLEELRSRLQHSDVHVVLMWLRPAEMNALYPVLRERKNFSVVTDDWWITPQWLMRDAEYIINRMYNGVASRLGESELVTTEPPLFGKPEVISPYAAAAIALRLPALAAWPFVDAVRRLQRRSEGIHPERLLYLPFSVTPDALPLKGEKIEHDFTLTGSTIGVWLMRDIYSSFKHTFANLYHDRERLMNMIAPFSDRPFKIHDWRRLPGGRPPESWEDYTRLARQSRYVIASGGLHNAGLPKHLEYACLGTPMIGPKTLFEFPWLDDCLFEVDPMRLKPDRVKPLLDEAMARYPVLRENCLNWRDQLFKLHDIHRLFDMLQAQADGRPIPQDYLRAGVKQSSRQPASEKPF
jgi:hypothetical protein